MLGRLIPFLFKRFCINCCCAATVLLRETYAFITMAQTTRAVILASATRTARDGLLKAFRGNPESVGDSLERLFVIHPVQEDVSCQHHCQAHFGRGFRN